MSEIIDFLLQNRSSNSYYTHTSMIEPTGKFQINNKDLDDLYEKYSNSEVQTGITEISEGDMPVMSDIDLKVINNKDGNNDLYTDEDILKIVKIEQYILRTIIKDCTDENLICCVLEKPGYVTKDKKYYKNGFHLQFPFTFLAKTDQESYFLPRLKKEVLENGMFSNYDINDVVDRSYLKNPWLLYGSIKYEHTDTYLLTKIYDKELNLVKGKKVFSNYKIYNSNHDIIPFTKEKNWKYYLPRILSIRPFGRDICQVKDDLPIIVKIPKKSKPKKKFSKIKHTKIQKEELKLSKKLLGILSQHRVENHMECMRIGWILYNISDGSEDGYDIWLNFCKNIKETHKTRGSPSNFNNSFCENEWSKMTIKDLTIGTLKFLAKNDNQQKYNDLMTDQMKEQITNCINIGGSHTSIARALYAKYGSEYVCSSITFKTWYTFNGIIWERIDEGVNLRNKISSEISSLFKQQVKVLQKELRQLNNEDVDSDELTAAELMEIQKEKSVESGRINEQIKKILKLAGCCEQAPYKNNVMKECVDIFYNKNFNRKLDSNKYIIAFKNGVYDLLKHEFIQGLPNHYLSIQLGVEYKTFFNNDKSVEDVNDFLNKVFPDKLVRKYFLDTTSSVFIGGNFHKLVLFWSGEGNNAKSVTQNIVEAMLGKYAIKLPTSLLVGKRTQASAACPELARSGNGVRWAVLQEPDKKDIINVGILKELSGNDTFFARGLYKEGGEITPLFKLTVICNDPPQLNDDQAAWNRIRVIPFESTFDDNAPPTIEEQMKQKHFFKDSNFDDKIPSMICAFAWVLLQHLKNNYKHITKKLYEPEKVLLATKSYQKKNDIYRQYVEEHIKDDSNGKISLTEMYKDFKDWHKESLPGHSLQTKNEVKDHFEKIWGEAGKGIKWKGYRLKTLEDEIEDGDVMLLEDIDFDHSNAPEL